MNDEEIVRALADITLSTIYEGRVRNGALDLITRLAAERDAAMAWFRAVEKTGSALCQTFDLATPAEEALRDVLTTACSLAEFEAFRAGAEAMRERAAVAADEYGMTYEVTIGRDRGVRTVEYKDGADAIRALPIGAPT